jgi:hypothetical protein
VNDLVAHCPKSFHDQVTAKLQALKVHCQPIVQWRNKRLGHKDLGTALRATPNPLPLISGSDIQEALEMLADILNDVLDHFEEAHVAYGAPRGMIGGGKDLILYLKKGLENMELDRRKAMGLED